jgi:hypothetical protein
MYADKMEHMCDCDSCEKQEIGDEYNYCPDCEIMDEKEALETELAFVKKQRDNLVGRLLELEVYDLEDELMEDTDG